MKKKKNRTEVAVEGYSERLPHLLEVVLGSVLKPNEFAERFGIVRDAMMRDLANANQVIFLKKN